MRISVQPAPGASVYAVEEQLPTGWTASQLSDGGEFDSVRGSVKFGPFFDTAACELTYEATPATMVSAVVSFAGVVSVDGVGTATSGVLETVSLLKLFRRMSNGQFELTMIGLPEARYAIRVSSNLMDWFTLTSVTARHGSLVFTDPDATSAERFYYPVPVPKEP